MTQPSASPAPLALIPPRPALDGPLTAALLRRSLVGYLLLAAAGLVLALSGLPALQAFGLGLVLPGGGFAAGFVSPLSVLAQAGLILLTLLLFLLALFAWFGSGNILAPVVVWLGSAAAAAALAPAQPWAGAPLLLLAVLGGLGIGGWQGRRAQLAEQTANRERRNTRLAALATRIETVDAPAPVAELGEDALGYLRYVLDRSLQPVERYDGIDWVDQFQFGALRYALCGMGYVLGGVQHGSLPAFRGYLTQAQRNLHQKMLDRRNWKYWVLENAWGNLSLDPDPIARDNIMYSGWFGAMLGEYIANTGDLAYGEQPLLWQHPDGRQWRYSFRDIAAILHRNFRSSDFTLFPCEPNWIYPMCNNFGAATLAIHDRVYGTRWWAEIEPAYRRHFDSEFVTLDGRVLAIRSTRTGLTIGALTSVMADCVTAHYLHGLLPDIARRSWEIARMDFIRVAGQDVELVTRGWDAMDTGSYKRSMITTYGQVGAAAAEMGDEEVAQLLRERVRREFRHVREDGVTRLEGVSTQAHAVLLALYAQGRGRSRSLITQGAPAATLQGPLLLEAPYPEVLVAYADSDGAALELVLRPGRAAARGQTQTLTLGQLRPGAAYRCEGALQPQFHADGQGRATLQVRLEGRLQLRVTPQA
ncbi:hypothetical protein D0B54_15480 [Solimonas sp. K1W22B-7]|uniref:linalool dehydratase/isomerase domain-containing protein n=1 Tax=Solimonas sp. K1W22B-7 TaxID=2303331 RepID=UPI000E335F45|nr:hypothetical protein [Solimonas sp. K1W22B-7]AXQ29988.1 hypothetical protein D0B54_15480 [Solimonas sp. K1W22B-7]